MKVTNNKICIIRRLAVIILGVYICINSAGIYANEAVDMIGTLITINEEVRLLEKPSTDAEVVDTFESGSVIMVLGEKEGYYTVGFRGNEYYVQKTATLESSVKAAVLEITDTEGNQQIVTDDNLNEEFQEENRISTILAEEMVRNQTERRRSIIWGSVIGILIVAVFAVGFFRTRKKGQEDEIGM